MAYFGKVYTLERNDNFDSFINSLNLPAAQASGYINSKPSQKIEKDGDFYVLTTINSNGTTEVRFKEGVEYDEAITPEFITKNVVTIEGNKFTQVKSMGDKSITLVREYTPEQLVVTLTASFWDGVAKRYYAAN